MAQTKWQIVEKFDDGFLQKRDVTQMPAGALIVGSQNVVITDGDRIAVREGTNIFGASSTNTTPITSMHTFRKRNGSEIMMRSYDEVLEYYHPDTAAWENLNDGYTAAQEFGYADHNVNTDNEDFVYFGNAVEPYTRWNGVITLLDGALSGGETEVTVDTVLSDDVFYSATASATTTTTLDIASPAWGTDLWNGFYVYITSGAQAGKISKITATTSNQITFGAIAGLSGTPTFEIRKVRFADSGGAAQQRLRIGTSTVTYTGFDDYQTFSGCSNVPAASDDAAVCQAVYELADQQYPRGNIFLVYNTRMFVSGVKGQESTIYYSAIADATDFTFSSPRTADEGGTIDTPEGGGPITGLELQEDVIYIFKENLVKTLTFTQDANDLPQIQPLIESVQMGPLTNKSVFKVDNQVYFVTREGGVKNIGRSRDYDYVQSKQLSDPIVGFVDDKVFTDAAGVYYKQKAYVACQQADGTFNDLVLPFNFQKGAWEAPIYGINASCFTVYDNKLYYGSATTPEVYEMEVDDRYDDNGAPIEAIARFAYNNYGAPANPKEYESVFMEGYISETTTITVNVRYNYLGAQETRTVELSGTEEDYIIENFNVNVLGRFQLGVQPLGGIVPEDDRPTELSKFRIYFQTTRQPFYELSIEVGSNTEGAEWEILRFGTDAKMLPNPVTKLRKQLA